MPKVTLYTALFSLLLLQGCYRCSRTHQKPSEILTANGPTVKSTIETIGLLKIIVPEKQWQWKITDQRPNKNDTSIKLCVAAAFTATDLKRGVGNLIIAGKEQVSESNKRLTGFCAINGQTIRIGNLPIPNQFIDSIRQANGYLFESFLLVHNGQPYDDKVLQGSTILRVFCLRKGLPIIIETTKPMSSAEFCRLLTTNQVQEAIYLDMGGWSYGWYRHNDTLHDIGQQTDHTKHQTNWLIAISNE